jgi:hypothetical protein
MRLFAILLLLVGLGLAGMMYQIQLEFAFHAMDLQKAMNDSDGYNTDMPEMREPTKRDIFFLTVGNAGHFLFLGGLVLLGFDVVARRKSAA